MCTRFRFSTLHSLHWCRAGLATFTGVEVPYRFAARSEYSFGQRVMARIAFAADVTEAPPPPNCICSDLHPLTERNP